MPVPSGDVREAGLAASASFGVTELAALAVTARAGCAALATTVRIGRAFVAAPDRYKKASRHDQRPPTRGHHCDRTFARARHEPNGFLGARAFSQRAPCRHLGNRNETSTYPPRPRSVTTF